MLDIFLDCCCVFLVFVQLSLRECTRTTFKCDKTNAHADYLSSLEVSHNTLCEGTNSIVKRKLNISEPVSVKMYVLTLTVAPSAVLVCLG